MQCAGSEGVSSICHKRNNLCNASDICSGVRVAPSGVTAACRPQQRSATMEPTAPSTTLGKTCPRAVICHAMSHANARSAGPSRTRGATTSDAARENYASPRCAESLCKAYESPRRCTTAPIGVRQRWCRGEYWPPSAVSRIHTPSRDGSTV